MKKEFNSFKEAGNFAKKVAETHRTTIRVEKINGIWVVEEKNPISQQGAPPTLVRSNRPHEIKSHPITNISTFPKKLNILKAHYLGRSLAIHHNKNTALQMIDAAINQLKDNPEADKKHRLLFYLLLKAETLREEKDILPIRKLAKELSDSLDKVSTYSDFMNIQGATQTTKNVYGIEKGLIADRGIRTTETLFYLSDTGAWTSGVHDLACRALGINERRLSDDEQEYLHHTSLAEILEQENINYNS